MNVWKEKSDWRERIMVIRHCGDQPLCLVSLNSEPETVRLATAERPSARGQQPCALAWSLTVLLRLSAGAAPQ